ncbi:MAG: glycoside hydrolase family 3 protein, partial [Erysipelotrichaceae bacterium]|nr:glycoside hydrolase family 3 protein [Erysipelotrichaceae bacterium]
MDAKEILNGLNIKEKLSLLTGSGYWTTVSYEDRGLPELFMCDGPLGLRKQDDRANADMMGINNSLKATCFPAAVTLASTWNKDVIKTVGKAIAEEAKDQHVGMVLGPGVNIKRNPLCGRNFEYYSEDPILAGELAASFIEGMESQGVASCIKHFACNSQEKDRFTSNGVISERALREIYLRAFETAIKKAHPSALMSSYPKINGEHCSDSKKLLTDILRDEWGFD